MGRKIKPLIYIFCEGESEIEYAKCLKDKFSGVAVIKKPVKGLFTEAESKFKKEARYRNNAEVTDEIWFFFDVDHDQTGSWKANLDIIKTLRKLRKRPNIRVRLLMTTGCVEYWYLLHYEKIRPSVQTIAEKDRIMMLIKKHVPGYFKGDSVTTTEIAKHIDQAVVNGRWAL
ncbi:MAG: RloB family protein, partial [Lachnospiraceae bacterium]|nr:RloB family protein [Lachnospiraceae bacterium]